VRRRNFISFVGLAGVADNERRVARRLGHFFEVPMLLLAIWIIVEWYLTANGSYPPKWEFATNWMIWVFFVLETVLLTFLVRDKRRYLISNWLNLLIIAGGVPLLWGSAGHAGALRSLRILLLFKILLDMSSTIRQMLSSNNIGVTLFVSLIITVMAGTSMAAIDPAIETPWDGIWWAWVTVTTVGYGDLVPQSPQGKVFGGLLMVLGLGLFSLITASFSAFLISRDEEGMVRKEEELIEKEEELLEQEQEVVSEEKQAIARLESIERRMGNLERGLDQLIERLSDESRAAAKTDGVEGNAPSSPEGKPGE
jgi:voltage-gated potassium channel